VRVSDRVALDLPGATPAVFGKPAPLPRLGAADVAVIDELDKVHALTGELIPHEEEAYLSANHLWYARENQVTLFAARNEFVVFEMVVRGHTEDIERSLSMEQAAGEITARFGRYRNVATSRGPLPDPIVPLAEGDETLPGQRSRSLHCEIYVPHNAPAGTH